MLNINDRSRRLLQHIQLWAHKKNELEISQSSFLESSSD